MPRVLIVDDDLDQIDIRRLILEQAGHDVWTATSATEALERFHECKAESVVMDLYLPGRDEGCGLIRDLRALSARLNIVVTTGWTAELPHLAERAMVNHVLQKPFKTEKLLRLLVMLLLCLLPVGALEFEVKTPREMVAEVQFDTTELSLSEVNLDGKYLAHVAVTPRADLFLGRLAAGQHELTFSRNPRKVRITAASESVLHAPIVYTRLENGDEFTDIPLLTYCERLTDAAGEYLQYTVIFSNEDGGTSTRALMARWGRTTDIEHVYRIWTASGRTQIQSQGHKDIGFAGKYEDKHPILFVTTKNNMVGPEGTGTVRYRPAPVVLDLGPASREKTMDNYPFTYEIARMELEKEGKLRPFGMVDGQKISDPRNYLNIEAEIQNEGSRVAFRVKLKDEAVWRSSHLGNASYAIERGGWVRSTIELPPNRRLDQVAEIGADCLVEPAAQGRPSPVSGVCGHATVSVWLGTSRRVVVAGDKAVAWPTGETRTWSLPSK